jgi:hypothetical protein
VLPDDWEMITPGSLGEPCATILLTVTDLADTCGVLENTAPPVPDLADTGGANATTTLRSLTSLTREVSPGLQW